LTIFISPCECENVFATNKKPLVYHLKHSHTDQDLFDFALEYGIDPELPKISIINRLINFATKERGFGH